MGTVEGGDFKTDVKFIIQSRSTHKRNLETELNFYSYRQH